MPYPQFCHLTNQGRFDRWPHIDLYPTLLSAGLISGGGRQTGSSNRPAYSCYPARVFGLA